MVHLVLRGFFFFLNAAWHFERQNLKIYHTLWLGRVLVRISKKCEDFDCFWTYLAVVSHELYAMSRIYPGGAEITRFYTHFLHVRVCYFTARQKKEEINMAAWQQFDRQRFVANLCKKIILEDVSIIKIISICILKYKLNTKYQPV